MDWAKRCAELSHAKRLHVGAVIVKDDTVISYGYNGMPAGWDNNCEDKNYISDAELLAWLDPSDINKRFPFEEVVNGQRRRYALTTKPEVLHAESNAIAKLAKSSNSGLDADLFVTHSPCLDCAKLIFQSGIKRVYFGASYRDDAGVKFLKLSGVEVKQVENDGS